MTIITLTTDDPAAARAALYDALDRHGPPVTIKSPGKPDLTVTIPAAELHERLVRLFTDLFELRERTMAKLIAEHGAERAAELWAQARTLSRQCRRQRRSTD